MSRKPRFAVVTAVVTILAILGALARVLRPLIPPQAHSFSNYADKGGFLEQAQNEPIRWLQLLDSDFTEAVQLNRPILVLTGAEWSREGRIADKTSFADGDFQALIGSDYLPVRIDCDESPEWLNAYFPLSYHTIGLDRGCQAFILSPTGAFYDFLQSGVLSERSDNLAVTQDLLNGKAAVNPDAVRSSSSTKLLLSDINALMSPAPPTPLDWDALLKTLDAATDKVHGGFPEDDLQQLKPTAYRFELMLDDLPLARQGMDPLLRSPIVDWMDGGFFRMANRDWSDLQFDKVAVVNSEMMEATALYAGLARDPYAKRIALNTFDCLVDQFAPNLSLLSSARIGDEAENGRSARCSFGVKDFRSFWASNVIPEKDRRWAITNLNMSLDKNGQMVPYVSDPSVPFFQGTRLSRVLHEMRSAKDAAQPRFGVVGYADVNGYVSARLIECARYWNDAIRLRKALDVKSRLEPLRDGADIRHRMHTQSGAVELTDYLGYADASLQDYLTTGNVKSFENGLQVLKQAKALFELNTPGAWLMARGSPHGLPLNYLTPEVADNLYESCTAREIRLMNAYSVLLQGNRRLHSVADEFSTDVKAAIRQFTPAATALGLHAAGFYCAARQAETGTALIVVGRDAEAVTRKLVGLYPFALVAQAKGPIRPDLQERGPGVYVVRGGKAEGPAAVGTILNLK